MESSERGKTEHTVDHEGIRSDERPRWASVLPVPRTVRALLGIEAASFLLAALVHAGVLLDGYQHREAMIAESVIGTVLLAGLAMAWVRSRSLFWIAVDVQAFALVGTFVGIWTIVVGIGPRTAPDIVYHTLIVLVLTFGIVLAWHSR